MHCLAELFFPGKSCIYDDVKKLGYIYIGNNTNHKSRFLLEFPNKDNLLTEFPQHCICGHTLYKHVAFLMHETTKELVTIGYKCINKLDGELLKTVKVKPSYSIGPIKDNINYATKIKINTECIKKLTELETCVIYTIINHAPVKYGYIVKLNSGDVCYGNTALNAAIEHGHRKFVVKAVKEFNGKKYAEIIVGK
jgi:hypothetical protein